MATTGDWKDEFIVGKVETTMAAVGKGRLCPQFIYKPEALEEILDRFADNDVQPVRRQ